LTKLIVPILKAQEKKLKSFDNKQELCEAAAAVQRLD
jgi:hypothetical protein